MFFVYLTRFMRKIGNILTNKKFDGGNFFNVVRDKSGLIEGIPTLVIGWDFTKENFPTANIIEWKIDDGVYWTFGNREKRSEYETRLDKFNKLCVENLVKSVNYNPVNILVATMDEKVWLNGVIESDIEKKIYIANDMVYIYIPSMNNVYGIYLQAIKYIGKNVKEFLAKIYKSKNSEIISAKLSENIPSYLFDVVKNRLYIVPALMYSE